MKNFRALFLILLAFPLFFACEDEVTDPDDDDDESTETVITSAQKKYIQVNGWIWEEMDLWYLWNDMLPEKKSSIEVPQDYFSDLLYSKDSWSYLAEDYKTWINSLQGISKSLGYSLALYYKDSGQKAIIAVVEFVYPNTPAALAGIKRGDIIGKINGTELFIGNYYDLLFDTETADITLLDDNYEYADTSFHVVAEEIEENPILHYEVIDIESKKIGYLVYVGYISNFNEQLNLALAEFKNANIEELVLDLRYNPGGDLGAAVELCSSIAPESVVDNNEILVKYQWNTDLQAYFVQSAVSDPDWNDQLRILFDHSVENKLNLNKLYVLTTGGTASASELTITGLDPYMEVIKIGETTHGKYAASITIPDEDSLWAMQPIVLKYANALGVTDFVNGFTPDYVVNDMLDYEFGDLDDPMLKKAVELILGHELESSMKSLRMVDRDFGPKIKSLGRNERIQNGILNIDIPVRRL